MLIGAMMSHLAKIIVTPFLYKWTTDYVMHLLEIKSGKLLPATLSHMFALGLIQSFDFSVHNVNMECCGLFGETGHTHDVT